MRSERAVAQVAVLVRPTLRDSAFAFVMCGTISAFTGWGPIEARVLLSIGLLFALACLWADRRPRRR
jgi:hypothetical protein